MAYVAARGGEQAIQNAEAFYRELNGNYSSEFLQNLEHHLPYLIDRVMGEGSLYSPELAALAIAQSGGDLYEAVLLLRAYRSTQPRLAHAETISSDTMLTVRRISAAFKDVPGGQVLGPTLDYSHRILHLEKLNADLASQGEHGVRPYESVVGAGDPSPSGAGLGSSSLVPALASTTDEPKHSSSFPFVADWLRETGLLPNAEMDTLEPKDIPDLTREPPSYPTPRAARLQALARADTGGILALGYSNMRGYGGIHPTVNEVRLAHADVRLKHPISGAIFNVGRVRVSSAEVVTKFTSNKMPPELSLGFAMCLGWNETKLIAAAMLDVAMDMPTAHPAHVEEFVLSHTEPVEASGVCIHYRLPHYVTFQSDLDRVRKARAGGSVNLESFTNELEQVRETR
jgi:alpha-D-ribose 1-methylphosphonate 5-triphosphate synthase subunit PhnI